MSQPGDDADAAAARGKGAQIAVGVVGAVAVFLLLLVALVLFDDDDGEIADLEPTTAPTPTRLATASPTPPPSPTPTPTPTPTPRPTVREPTDADAADFVAAFEPPDAEGLESVTVDVTGDEVREIVFVSRSRGATRLDVAGWDGRSYQIVFADQGGEAEEITNFTVTDLNGDAAEDILTRQTVGEKGESLSLWGYDGEQIAPQVADGGCWHGAHTYGVVGAEIGEEELAATCDDSPLPQSAWSTDVYVWDGDAYRWVYDRTKEP